MKLKIFDITQVTESAVNTWTNNKVIYHILCNNDKFYVFYDEGGIN